MYELFNVIGMAGGPAASGDQNPFGMMMPMLIIFAIFYFMLIRPQQRREKERRSMVDAVKSGDKVVFASGMMGTVSNVKETTLVIKIADNVKVEVIRSSVTRIINKGDKVEAEEK